MTQAGRDPGGTLPRRGRDPGGDVTRARPNRQGGPGERACRLELSSGGARSVVGGVGGGRRAAAAFPPPPTPAWAWRARGRQRGVAERNEKGGRRSKRAASCATRSHRTRRSRGSPSASPHLCGVRGGVRPPPPPRSGPPGTRMGPTGPGHGARVGGRGHRTAPWPKNQGAGTPVKSRHSGAVPPPTRLRASQSSGSRAPSPKTGASGCRPAARLPRPWSLRPGHGPAVGGVGRVSDKAAGRRGTKRRVPVPNRRRGEGSGGLGGEGGGKRAAGPGSRRGPARKTGPCGLDVWPGREGRAT